MTSLDTAERFLGRAGNSRTGVTGKHRRTSRGLRALRVMDQDYAATREIHVTATGLTGGIIKQA